MSQPLNKKHISEVMSSFDTYCSMLNKIAKEDPKVILECCETKPEISDEQMIENFKYQIKETKRIVQSYCDFMKAPLLPHDPEIKKNLS